jgi:ribosomal protein L40E
MGEFSRYVISNYYDLLTRSEKAQLERFARSEKRNGPLPEVKQKLKEEIHLAISDRILREHELDLNICTICGTLARTPKASQCRNGHKKILGQWVLDPGGVV